MDTPICDFVRAYADSEARRLHMPGHKGRVLTGPEPLDITEIPGADVLYDAQGIIARSQENAARLFGAACTLYSAEGSSLAIRAMLALVARGRTGPVRIAAGRNAHKVFMTACALLELQVDWLCPEGSLLRCPIAPQWLDRYLSEAREKPAAVYVTSPDYLGNMLDIRGLARVCHRYGVLLLVDNAHGAYLRFLPQSLHPMDLGADLCCDSAHKTLPVLTGGAYLHISAGAPECFRQQAAEAMALFASTSPSYLILQSLDRANAYLAGDYRQKLAAFVQTMDRLKERLCREGYTQCAEEPGKLTLLARDRGYTGRQLAQLLRDRGLICEFADPDYLVLMLTPENSDQDIRALEEALRSIPQKPALPQPQLQSCSCQPVLSPRQAMLAPWEWLPLAQCGGRILAQASVSCPPAVPVAVCGERLDADALARMAYYGITACQVVIEE